MFLKKNFIQFIIYISFLLFFFIIIVKSENIVEIKNPIFTTKSINGNPYEIKANRGFQNKSHLDLFIVEAKLKTNHDAWIYLNADRGSFDQSSGEIKLEKNIIVYTDTDEKIFADLAKINTNEKIITLINNVKYSDHNIQITADKSIIKNEFTKIIYSGNVKSKIVKRKVK